MFRKQVQQYSHLFTTLTSCSGGILLKCVLGTACIVMSSAGIRLSLLEILEEMLPLYYMYTVVICLAYKTLQSHTAVLSASKWLNDILHMTMVYKPTSIILWFFARYSFYIFICVPFFYLF